MSYCRWSSDNWRSDVYCYENVSGAWTTHVAKGRYREPIPQEPDLGLFDNGLSPDEWMKRHQTVMDYLETCGTDPIGLPHDGETFDDENAEAMLERLKMLRGAGYRVPEYVFETLQAEIREDNQ